MQSILFWSAVTLYALATVAWFAWAATGKDWGANAGRALLAAGLLPHAGSLAMRWIEVGHGPYNTRYEVISADTFIVVAVWLVATVLAKGLVGLGVFVAPSAFLLMGWSVSTFDVKREVPIIFKSWWLFLHIGFAKLFFASILIAAACAIAYLVKVDRPGSLRRLPPPERLDLYEHQFTIVAFLFLGVMIVAGALWAHQSWGRYWGWDPMETSALVTWIVTAIVLHFRVLHRWSGKRMAWLTLVAFGFAVVTLFVVAVLVPTIHNSYMVGS